MLKQIVLEKLNRIIAFLHDSQSCYQDHVNHVENSQLKSLFIALKNSRKKMIEEISAFILELGGEPAKTATLLGQSHRAYENMKTLISQNDVLVIAKEIRRGESVLIQYYLEALKEDLPKLLYQKLTDQLTQIEDDIKAVDQLVAKPGIG